MNASKITIVNYGSGNLHSISKALMRLGAEVEISESPDTVAGAAKLVLPGVGHFGDAMGELAKRTLIAPIRAYATSGRPFLGVCVGLQLLMESSEEAPGVEGLGIVDGACRKFVADGRKIPHMGWNNVTIRRRCPILDDATEGEETSPLAGSPYFYFVHSYYAVPVDAEAVAASCSYGEEFCAVLATRNIQATQFHPEKSQRAGLALLRNFIAMKAD